MLETGDDAQSFDTTSRAVVLEDLPNELLIKIAAYYHMADPVVDPNDTSNDISQRRALSAVNRHFRVICKPYLFRHVDVAHSNGVSELECLMQTDSVRSYVESCTIRAGGGREKYPRLRLRSALASMKQIRAVEAKDLAVVLPSVPGSPVDAPMLPPIPELVLCGALLGVAYEETKQENSEAPSPLDPSRHLEKLALVNMSQIDILRICWGLRQSSQPTHLSYLCISNMEGSLNHVGWRSSQITGLAIHGLSTVPTLTHLSLRGFVSQPSMWFVGDFTPFRNLRILEFTDGRDLPRSLFTSKQTLRQAVREHQLNHDRHEVARAHFERCPKLERLCLNGLEDGCIFRPDRQGDEEPIGVTLVDAYLGPDDEPREGQPICGGVYPEGAVWEKGWPRITTLRLEEGVDDSEWAGASTSVDG